ncbi:MAG: aspartate kinase [Peptoniphilaceae bacterium]|nr:aspartate kinase [Peptoniphilaceae bacterium]MDD7383661.1 aspartate kinase [Peptoniphilaceae bacterium]MDY3737832.1 aspartate kinase [Peptoniphilaceae bacterium]
MKKVAKFGGSSVANANQIKKVVNIVKNDKEIKALVVSAPGKRFDKDIKVTDLLIQIYTEYINKSDQYLRTLKDILQRYEDICNDLKIDNSIIIEFENTILSYFENIDDLFYLKNAILSCGENFNAQIINLYLNSQNIKSKFLSPKEAGITLINTMEQPIIDEITYKNLNRFEDFNDILVVPGFFGYSQNNEILTFLRGGSDITGAIVARGINADIYENYTDQSYIYSADPNIIDSPKPVKNISFEEMRELSYNGFGIFQEDAVEPLLNTNINIQVKNTNDPYIGGTVISAKRKDTDKNKIVGISCVDNMISFNVTEYLLNRKSGYTNRLLDIFRYNHISIEHIPTGIDSISVIFKEEQIKSKAHKETLINNIKNTFNLDDLSVKEHLSSIAIVGSGINENRVDILYEIISILKKEKINIEYLIQGASKTSIFIIVENKFSKKALSKLYESLFK